jgi:DNA-binding NtrC family response regulator
LAGDGDVTIHPPPLITREDETKQTKRTAQRELPRLEWTENKEPKSAIVERRSVLGSAPHCDIVIADRAVSRVHAELEPRSEGLWIRDLNSRNGTLVGGVPIEAACVLHGYTIRVGSTDIHVNYQTVEQKPARRWPSDTFGPLLGRSDVMRELFATLHRLAQLDACIMIQGETGSGKEVVARAIHQASRRASGPFIVVDCGALSETLIEAELFGHTKGAFTGAVQARAGAIESAHGGTVFLDEIGELPLAMQPKLLRVLESSTIRRVGEAQHRNVDVRFVTASHRDLLSMVNRGEFREDLYFRLAVFPVRVPPLRERAEDIGMLLDKFSEGSTSWLTSTLLKILEQRPWRGNVRELRTFAQRARALGPDDALTLLGDAEGEAEPITKIIERKDLPIPAPPAVPSINGAPPGQAPSAPLSPRGAAAQASSHTPPLVPPPASLPSVPVYTDDGEPVSDIVPSPPGPTVLAGETPTFAQSYRTFRDQWMDFGEKAFVTALLDRHQRNVAAAAKDAGLDRTYLYRLMRKHNL